MSITFEQAQEARDVLIEYIEQEVDIDYTELYGEQRNEEKLLYLALKQNLAII